MKQALGARSRALEAERRKRSAEANGEREAATLRALVKLGLVRGVVPEREDGLAVFDRYPCPHRSAVRVVTISLCGTCERPIEVGKCALDGAACSVVGHRIGPRGDSTATKCCLTCEVRKQALGARSQASGAEGEVELDLATPQAASPAGTVSELAASAQRLAPARLTQTPKA